MGDPLAMRRQVRFTEQRGRCKFFNITMQYRPASGDINIKQHPVQTTSRESDMAVTQAIPITRHPYANGSYKKMLIDG